MKILMFFSSGLGDALLIAPTIFALRNIYPSADISAAVPYVRFNKFLLENVLGLNNVLHLKRLRSLRPGAVVSYINFFCKFTKEIRRQKFDMIIVTVQACLPDQYFLARISGAKQRIGPRLWRGRNNTFRFLLTTQTNPNQHGHLINNHFEVIRSLNKDINVQKYVQKTTDTLISKAQPCGFTPITDKLIIILPGSGTQAYKRWPFSKYLQTAQEILNRYNCDIAILGGSGEYDQNLIPPHLANNDRFHDLSNTLNIPQLIDLFCNANLVLSNDSGLLHLAEFLNTPTIAIYPGNWTYVSKRYFDNDTRHIVLPKDQPDILAEQLLRHTWRNKKIQNLCRDVVNSVKTDDLINEIHNSGFL
ncbi:MAG: glycosyltransferase family 9 protein [Sedimentisphaerales bacterium]|nr:glycosyltransferase family 9 protein [Sedimentisphaerales bacterium]